jgi:hypothetical protein
MTLTMTLDQILDADADDRYVVPTLKWEKTENDR